MSGVEFGSGLSPPRPRGIVSINGDVRYSDRGCTTRLAQCRPLTVWRCDPRRGGLGRYPANVLRVGRPLGEFEKHFAEVELADKLKNYALPLAANEGVLTVETSLQDGIRAHDRHAVALRQVISDNILLRAHDIANNAGVTTVSTRSDTGDAASEIVAAARAVGADLIVLGRRGLSGIAELLLGSVSQKVLHRAQVDVLTVA